MLEKDIEIINQLGLHARASAKMVSTASKFGSDINLISGAKSVNAKSIMGVMMLAAGIGTTITITVNGSDEDRAMEAVTALINDRFGEES